MFFSKKKKINEIDMSRLPQHIGIIMDGNGRWAKKRGLPRSAGHSAGADSLKKIITEANNLGVKYITVYAFSTENWKRPKEEVDYLMSLLLDYLRNAEKIVMNIALNYGGREEIVNAVKNICKDVKDGKQNVDDIDDEVFSSYLYTANQPDVDLLIRTSGEQRLSNFMLWQVSYAEMWFTDKLWPDFKPADLHKAIIDFQNRGRRFGGV